MSTTSIRRLSSLSATATLAVLALAGCSLPGSHAAADRPSNTAAIKPHRSAPAPASSPTPSPTPSATPTPTPTPTPSTSPSASASGPVFINFKHTRITLPISPDTVPSAPDGLVQAVGIYLNHLWQKDFAGDPGCEQEVVASLDRTRSDGFAWVDINDDPTLASCAAATGGGVYVIFAEPAGAWRPIFTGQDAPPCALLERYGVPDDILGRQPTCADPSAAAGVPYSHP